MPSALLRRDREPGLAAIKDLAAEFGTSLTAAAVRFVEENKENCLVVFSENGRVLWWRGKDGSVGLWIEPRRKIHQDSAAWECFYDGVGTTGMRRVPTAAWFQNLRFGKHMEVYEQSMRLGRQPAVLTLLWILED